MNEQARNVIIGVFVLAAIVLVIWMVLFLHPTVGDGEEILRVRFTNVEKVSIGTRVTFAGKPVGQVVAINQIFEARAQPQPDDVGDKIYFFELVLAVDSSVQVYDTDSIILQTQGLFGEKVINITPVKPPAGVTPVKITKQVIYAQSGDQMQDMIAQVSEVAQKVGNAFEGIEKLVNDKDGELFGALKAVRIAFEDVNESNLIDSMKEAANAFGEAMESIDGALSTLDEDEFWTHLDDAILNVGEAFDGIKGITGNMKDGKGTLGRLLNEEELYFKTLSIMDKGDTLLGNLNNYGILYNWNSKWKKEQKRKKMMQRRSVGQVFSCEVDQISRAVSRLSRVLDQTQSDPCAAHLFKSPDFSREFDRLVNQVQGLDERLHLLQEQK